MHEKQKLMTIGTNKIHEGAHQKKKDNTKKS